MANGFQGPPAVDFYSMLSGLGDTIAANRTAQAKRDAFAAATTPGPDGKIDYGKAILGLAQADPQSAALFAQRQNHEDTLKQQAIENTRNAARDTSSDQHWNADYGLRKAASVRADDPTPAGFAKQADGTYAPLVGGPQDPTYQARVAAETAKAKGDVPTIIGAGSSVIVPNKAADGPLYKNSISGGMSDDALDIKARQWNAGDYDGATKNIGRGAQAGATLEAIANRSAKLLIEQGMNPEQAAASVSRNMQAFKASSLGQGAEARTAGVREANLNLILRAADAAIPAALDASDKVSRTGWVPVNKVIQNGEVISSNPELKRFGMANLQLAEHWARAMNPTGVMRESDRDKALSFLSTADSKDTYRQAVDQLRTQIVRERDAVKGAPVTPSAPSFRPGGNEPTQAPNPIAPQPNVTSTGIKWSVQ